MADNLKWHLGTTYPISFSFCAVPLLSPRTKPHAFMTQLGEV